MKKYEKKIKADVQTDFGLFEAVLEATTDTGGYMVRVPRVPEVVTWGKNIAHAKAMAKEAIELTVETKILLDAERAGKIRTIRRHISSRGLALA